MELKKFQVDCKANRYAPGRLSLDLPGRPSIKVLAADTQDARRVAVRTLRSQQWHDIRPYNVRESK